MSILDNVARRLKEIRKEMKITQKEMGEIMGVSRASYSLYENGKLPIDVLMLDKLYRKTGYSVSYLLGYSEYKYIEPVPMDVKVIHGEAPPVSEKETEIVIQADEVLAGQAGIVKKFVECIVEDILKERGV